MSERLRSVIATATAAATLLGVAACGSNEGPSFEFGILCDTQAEGQTFARVKETSYSALNNQAKVLIGCFATQATGEVAVDVMSVVELPLDREADSAADYTDILQLSTEGDKGSVNVDIKETETAREGVVKVNGISVGLTGVGIVPSSAATS